MAFKLDNLQSNKEQHSSFNIQSILQKEIVIAILETTSTTSNSPKVKAFIFFICQVFYFNL